jgi:outer membrane protein assembly factor BamD
MIVPLPVVRRAAALAAVLCLAGALGACKGHKSPLPAPGAMDADKFLFDKGTENLEKKKWLTAREYFRRLFDTYPRSQYRQQAKLGIGDSYIGEARIESYILGANEFREFLQFFPADQRTDYAQYRLSLALMKQMLSAQRDQTATKEALVELDRFRQSYPNSKFKPEVEKLYRETRDRLSDSEFLVGQFHFRSRLYAGAISRLQGLLTDDPGYTHKDEVYFLLGETYYKALLLDQALPYYERLAAEFPSSKRMTEVKKRLAEIKPKSTTGKSGDPDSGADPVSRLP